jgi:hypothetical protein
MVKTSYKHRKFWEKLKNRFIHRSLTDGKLKEIVDNINSGVYISSHNMSEKQIKNNFIGYYLWDAYDDNFKDTNPYTYIRHKLIPRKVRNEYIKNIGFVYRRSLSKEQGIGNKELLKFNVVSKKDYEKIKHLLK